MTRLYLISSIVTGAILLQFLTSRPPEVEWVQPEVSAETSLNQPASNGKSPAVNGRPSEPQKDDPLLLARNALNDFAVLIGEAKEEPDSLTRIHLKDGATFDVLDTDLQKGEINVSLPGGQSLQISPDQVSHFETVDYRQKESDNETFQILARIKSGERVSDEELTQWLESGEAESFVEQYPHSSNRRLVRHLIPITSSSTDLASSQQGPVDTDELDEWMADVRSLMTRKVSGSKRTELLLEMDQRLSQLSRELSLSPQNREKITQFANRLRILKLDLIKSTGF
ncbi:MAG: hypothetical protein ACPG1Z_09455 [Planctomycetota bacterium]